MVDNAQKTPFGRSMNSFARAKAQDAIQLTGRALPCSVVSIKGSIVQVKFEIQSSVFTLPNVTIPLFGPEYIRYPVQPGCKGVTIAADAYLGGMSGLGGGVADLTVRGNLTALVFLPIANSNWFTVDANSVVIYGPNGVTLMDQGQAVTFALTPNGITVNLGGNNLTVNNGTVIVPNGDVVIEGIHFLQHEHSAPNGNTGPPFQP